MKTYRRGEVWYKVDTIDQSSRVQSGSRPVLIFSSDDGNNTSDVVSVIPLTSEYKPDIDINIVFKANSKRQTALCNMLGPCDKSKLVKYMFTVSDSVMERIEHGVLIANQMNHYITDNSGSDMFKLFSQFKSLVDGMVLQKFNELMKSTIDKQNSKISEMSNSFDKLKTKSTQTERSKENNDSSLHHTDTVGANTMKNALAKVFPDLSKDDEAKDKLSEQPQKEVKRRKYIKKSSTRKVWTIDLCKQFVEDKMRMPAVEMVKKYDLVDAASVSKSYTYCRSKLNKAGIDYEGK